MKLSGIRCADIVEVDRKGRRFMARVEQVQDGLVSFKPICREGSAVNYFTAKPREIVGHYSKRKGSA